MDFFSVESGSSNPDSGPSSPPVHASAQLSPPAGHTTPIQEVGHYSQVTILFWQFMHTFFFFENWKNMVREV